MEDRYVIKYYYNNKFIGYHNGYGKSRGNIWTRIYAGNNEKYIKKYNSERGAKIGVNSEYWKNSTEVIIHTDTSPISLHFDNYFVDTIRNKGYGIYEESITKEICKLSEIGNESLDLSEVKEIETKYNKYINEKISKEDKKEEDIKFHPTQDNSKIDSNLENQFKTILTILNKTEEDIIGGLIYIDDLTIEQLHAIQEAAPDFYKENENHNWSPTNKEFEEFISKNPQFIAEAYLVTPQRNDYRFNLVGVKAPINKENKALLFDFINSLDIDHQPDEYGTYNGYIRAWWD